MATRGTASGLTRGQVVALLLLFLAIYATMQVAPPYLRDYQAKNAFDDEARRAHIMADEEIRRNIVNKLQDIGLGDILGSEDILIRRDPSAGRISVRAEYDVEVEVVPGKVVTLHFAPEVDRPIRKQ